MTFGTIQKVANEEDLDEYTLICSYSASDGKTFEAYYKILKHNYNTGITAHNTFNLVLLLVNHTDLSIWATLTDISINGISTDDSDLGSHYRCDAVDAASGERETRAFIPIDENIFIAREVPLKEFKKMRFTLSLFGAMRGQIASEDVIIENPYE